MSTPGTEVVLRTVSSTSTHGLARKWSEEEDRRATGYIATVTPENGGSMAQLLLDLSAAATNCALQSPQLPSSSEPSQPQQWPHSAPIRDDSDDSDAAVQASTLASKKRIHEAAPATGAHRKHKSLGSAGRWTVEEDSVLRNAVEAAGVEDWVLVSAKYMRKFSRSEEQCKLRWDTVLQPGLVKGKWTATEDAKILSLISRGLETWAAVSRSVEGRSEKQCRERFLNHLDPRLVKGKWTGEEDATLVAAHGKWGSCWHRISGFLPGRSENAVKNRWNSAAFNRVAKQACVVTDAIVATLASATHGAEDDAGRVKNVPRGAVAAVALAMRGQAPNVIDDDESDDAGGDAGSNKGGGDDDAVVANGNDSPRKKRACFEGPVASGSVVWFKDGDSPWWPSVLFSSWEGIEDWGLPLPPARADPKHGERIALRCGHAASYAIVRDTGSETAPFCGPTPPSGSSSGSGSGSGSGGGGSESTVPAASRGCCDSDLETALQEAQVFQMASGMSSAAAWAAPTSVRWDH